MTAIFATVKNEADQILEWLAFHKLQGFDRFILGLDDCTDKTKELIESSIFSSNCNLVNLNNLSYPHKRSKQIHFFKYAINILKQDNVEWALPIDIDEYIYSPSGGNLFEILSKYDSSGVAVCQRTFGSSGLENRPEGQLVIESFTKYVNDDLDLSTSNMGMSQWVDPGYIKVFIKPKDVLTYGNAHLPVTIKPFVYETGEIFKPNNRMGWTKNRPMDLLRINHYFTQDKAHWNKKILNGRVSGAEPYSDELYNIYASAENIDTYLQELAPKVKELLSASSIK